MVVLWNWWQSYLIIIICWNGVEWCVVGAVIYYTEWFRTFSKSLFGPSIVRLVGRPVAIGRNLCRLNSFVLSCTGLLMIWRKTHLCNTEKEDREKNDNGKTWGVLRGFSYQNEETAEVGHWRDDDLGLCHQAKYDAMLLHPTWWLVEVTEGYLIYVHNRRTFFWQICLLVLGLNHPST